MFLRCLATTLLWGAGSSPAVGQNIQRDITSGGAAPSPPPAADVARPPGDQPTDSSAPQAARAEPAGGAPAKIHPSQPLRLAVGVRGTGACVDRAMLLAQVARWLERDTVDDRIRVDVVFGPGDQDVRFRVHRSHGEPTDRELEGLPAACDALLSAAGLSIALAIDAAILEALRVPDDAELVEIKRRPGLLDRLRPTQEPHRFSLALGLAGGLSTGMLPATAPVAIVNLHGLVAPWLELRVGGLFATVSGQTLPEVPAVRYRATVWAGRADACAHATLTDWLVALGCAGVQVGAFITKASGEGLQPAGASARPLWAVGLGLAARASVSAFLELALAVDLSLPLADRVVQVEDPEGGLIDQRALLPAGMLVSAGPVWRFF